MLPPWASGSRQILIGSSNDLPLVNLLAQTVAKLWATKVGVKKSPRPFEFEAIFFATLCIELLLSERPGFDTRPAQSLRGYSFATFGSKWPKITFFERSNLFLLV